tara:strand:- start:105 stop:257 length:153 start_codon:yes stop_codon:yes gene_type:complete
MVTMSTAGNMRTVLQQGLQSVVKTFASGGAPRVVHAELVGLLLFLRGYLH